MTLRAVQSDLRLWLESGSDEAAARFAPDAMAGLSIYQNNYRSALLACLEDSFPRTAQWLGPSDFRASAARTIDASPPDSWSLDHYAGAFPRSLAAQWPDDPVAGDLAALEMALAEAFVGPDAPPLGAGELTRIDWDQATLTCVPTARLVLLQTNAPAIWSALAADASDGLPHPLFQPATVLVWRQEHVACFRTLDPDETEAMQRLMEGVLFTELCSWQALARGETDGIQTAGQWLGRWVADGLLDRTAVGGG